jgi:hypothetical protein
MWKRYHERRHTSAVAALLLLAAVSLASGCGGGPAPGHDPTPRTAGEAASDETITAAEEDFLDDLEARTFRFFWDETHPATGLAPDRAPTRSFASVAATGFALTAYPIGAERGWVGREAAAARALLTLRFLWDAPQGNAPSGCTGHRGFFYHFLDPNTGHRFREVELSTVDTALLLAGALFCQSYFDGDAPDEVEIRALTDSLYARVDWRWASVRPPTIGHGWKPESGHLPYDWRGYNEAMILYLLALASPTHPVPPEAWDAWTSGYRWGAFHGEEHLGFAPLFGHQYTHVWIDLRGVQDAATRSRDIDYFENSRRAVRAQHAYAAENPAGWTGYGPELWGLTACDGPVNAVLTIGERERTFHTYWARGASFTVVEDDGTICPSAAAASIAFEPALVLPALTAMRRNYGDHVYSTYGFLDALNPTFTADVQVQHGHVVPGLGWFDTDYLGIDQGPILAMIENRRSGLVWRVMRRNPAVARALRRAGFAGGWLDTTAVEP